MMRTLLAWALLACATGSSSARTLFNPQIAIEQAYTDDVQFVGGGTSDSLTRLSALLPVVRETKRSTFEFSYAPSIQRYQDSDELDHTTHLVTLSAGSTTSRRSNVNFVAMYLLNQLQGRSSSLDEAELFVTGRTDRELYRGDFSYNKEFSQRWSFRGGLNYGESRFESIDDFDPLGPVPVEDRVYYGGTLGLGRAVSGTTTLGFEYGLQRFELEPIGTPQTTTEETAHSLTFTIDRAVSRRTSLDATLGAFRNETDEGDATRTGVQATLGLDRSYRTVDLRLEAQHQPSAGGSLPGTSTDSAIGLDLHGTALDPWIWSFSTRLARRDPNFVDEEVVTSVAAGGSIERSFARALGLRLSANYIDQQSDDPDLKAGYLIAAVGLVWYPLGRSELAGGKGP
jgi:hypothetical protein